jgi:hypothetical protein
MVPASSSIIDEWTYLGYKSAMLKKDVLTFYGSQAKVAEVLGITRQAVSLWSEVVPKSAATDLQLLTGGQLKMDRSLYGKRKRRKKTDS